MAKKRSGNKKSQGGGGKGWLLLLVLLAAGYAGYNFLTPAQVSVPDVVGMSRDEATRTITSQDLKVSVKEVEGEGEAGKVVRQFPDARQMVPRASIVTIEVVGAAPTVTIPEVAGQTRSEAEDNLRRLGLTVTFEDEKVDNVPVGRVIKSRPAAGQEVAPGSSVTLVVSAGKGSQSIPDLTGLPLETATRVLKDLGLGVTVQYVAQAGFKTGDPVRIIRSEPASGEKVSAGTSITVFLPVAVQDRPDTGGGDGGVHAPRFEGLTVAAAQELAGREGVTLKFADTTQPNQTITFQEPPPGDPLDQSRPTVVVRVAASAVVPGLAGLSEAEARNRIEKAELTVGSIRKAHGDVPGEVIGQSPSSGIEVVAGSRVDLIVADPSLTPSTARGPAPPPTPAFTPAPWVE